jgi:hypothetical protein
MKARLQFLGTAWTVWKVATKRVGPVGGVLVTAVVMGALVYLKPWLTEKIPALEGIIGNP